ncbi:MAG: amino acid adenylation domain-containing protein [Selenomonadaceae bacterium]|nr:amino acid adenylation domain-containing protein [Selenomonadaceae bacterium]
MDIKKILEVSTGEKFSYDTTKTWLDIFKSQVAKTPENIAVTDENSEISYKKLDELSDKVAAWLIENGVEENQFVAIRIGRVKEFMAAVIGIWKVGAAYLPIDLEYPEERINYMLEDSEAKITLTEKIISDISQKNFQTKIYKTSPENLAYMIYTSGTTGKPKGVMIQHKALMNFVHFIKNRWALTEKSRITCHSNFAFDAAVEDLYPVLMTGGTMFIVPEIARHDIFEMQKFIAKHKITGGGYTTRFGQILAAKDFLDVDYICLGGEAMTSVPNVRGKVFNTYGPTEFTVDATYFELEKGKKYNPIPIGRPLYNCAAFIVDKETKTKLLPLGEIGELCLAGPQLAAGYWKRPELTAEKFNEIEVGDKKVKVYHTGDLAKYNDDGNLEFYGRIDFQVKIRGFRVELPEIEDIIRQFDGIKDTTVVALDKPAGGKYIVAYVVSDSKVDVDALHNFIAKSKPPYMVPSFTVQIDKIPLNQNQKIDTKKLPVPKRNLEGYEQPQTPTEKLICEKMAQVLSWEVVGVNDDFFKIGGDSLTTIMLITECNHPAINISSIYQYRTPRELAAYCDSLGNVDSVEDIQAKNSDAMKKPQPLNLAQKMYLKMFKENPDALYNNIPALFVLKDDVDLNKLQTAVNKVLANHPALRAKFFADENGEYKQAYDETFFTPIEIIDLSDDEFENLKGKLVKPFNLSSGGFCRGAIYRTPSANYLFLDFHHIVTDGFSILVIYNEIYACYQDENYKLPEDFYFYLLENIVGTEETKSRAEAKAYCDKIFRSEDSLTPEEISLKPDHTATTFKGAVKMFPLDIPKNKLRGNVAYTTACALAVCAYNNSNRAVIRFTHYGRNNNLSMSSVGLFADAYPIMLVKEDGDTPEKLIAKVQEQVSFVEAHLDYQYFAGIDTEKIVRFIYHKDITDLGDIVGLTKDVIELDTDNSDATDSLFGASVADESSNEKLIFVERYAGNCYDEESEERFRKLFIDAAKYLAGMQ